MFGIKFEFKTTWYKIYSSPKKSKSFFNPFTGVEGTSWHSSKEQFLTKFEKEETFLANFVYLLPPITSANVAQMFRDFGTCLLQRICNNCEYHTIFILMTHLQSVNF